MTFYKSICIIQLRAGLIGLMLYVRFHIYILLALAQIQVTCMTSKSDDRSIIVYITIIYLISCTVLYCLLIQTHKHATCNTHAQQARMQRMWKYWHAALLQHFMHTYLFSLIDCTINVTAHSCTHAGELPYKDLGNAVILSSVMTGYRLDSPEECPEQV